MKSISKIIQWFFTVTFILLSFGTGSIVASIFVLLAAVLMAPIKPIREYLLKFKIKSFVLIILSIIMLFIGIAIAPASEEIDNSSNVNVVDTTVKNDVSTTIMTTTETTTEESTTNPETTAEESTTEETTTEIAETITKKETTTKEITTEKETTTKETTTKETTTKETTTKKETTTRETTTRTSSTGTKYTLNIDSKKFHYPKCPSAKKISPENYAGTNKNREELIAEGYKPCGNCDP